MTDDLVERLKDWPYQCETMFHEAADRIEALTAEVDRLKQEVHQFRRVNDGLQDAMLAAEAEVDRSRAARVEIYWLREALTIIGNDAGLPVGSYRNSLELAQAVASAALKGQQP